MLWNGAMERWTDAQLVNAIVVISRISGIAIFVNGPLDRLLAFFGMSASNSLIRWEFRMVATINGRK